MTLEYFKDAAQGKKRLAEIFWWGYVAGNVAYLMCAVLLFTIEIVSLALSSRFGLAVAAMAEISFAVFQIWVSVSLWNCAFNVRRHFWGYLARAYVVIINAQWVMGIAIEAIRGTT